MLKDSYGKTTKEIQTLAYILRFISDGKNEEQIIEIFNGDKQLVKTWIETLIEIHFIAKNSFNEIAMTPDGNRYLEKFDSISH
jgi:predicted transcriptional regulator